MGKTLTMDVPVYSSRFAHEDTYLLSLGDDYLKLSFVDETAICEWTTGGPRWKPRSNSLEHVLMHDYINFPALFKKDLKLIWARWVRGEYNDDKTKQEMDQLFFWLNLCTKGDEEREKLRLAGEDDW